MKSKRKVSYSHKFLFQFNLSILSSAVKFREDELVQKDKETERLRLMLEKSKEIYHKRLETEKRRVYGSERVVSRLEQQILEFYRQLEMKKNESRLRGEMNDKQTRFLM